PEEAEELAMADVDLEVIDRHGLTKALGDVLQADIDRFGDRPRIGLGSQRRGHVCRRTLPGRAGSRCTALTRSSRRFIGSDLEPPTRASAPPALGPGCSTGRSTASPSEFDWLHCWSPAEA